MVTSDDKRDWFSELKQDSFNNESKLNKNQMLEVIQAMKNDEFKIFIQPQFDVKTKKIISGEVLTRWQRSDGKLVVPEKFITLFEENQFIKIFDLYILEKTCRKLKEWITQKRKMIPIAINQSRLHLDTKDYIDDFCNIIDKYEIPHKYIVFELTESGYIKDCSNVVLLTNQLRDRGFSLAIDDFGTGYAYMSILSSVSANLIKLDKSLLKDFVTNKKTQIIILKMIEMAHQMKMKVLSEGVESQEQFLLLEAMECDYVQGYLFGKAIATDEFANVWMN